VAAGDSEEAKLPKNLHAGAAMRTHRSKAEKDRTGTEKNKEKDPGNSRRLWKKQRGYGFELTWLFLGLARAAGFEASGMWVSDRQTIFSFLRPWRVESWMKMSWCKLNGKDTFFDPGAAFVPFGCAMVRNQCSGSPSRQDGGSWLQTRFPPAADSGIQRNAGLNSPTRRSRG